MFVDVVIAPALKRPRGLLRLRALFEHWLRWENEVLSGGCLFATASAELDDRPGPVRDHLVGHVQDMLGTIARAVRITIDEAHFRPDVEPEQLAFEMWSILLAYQQYERLLRHDNAERRARDAFERLVETSRSAS
jgi:hypothetical protein